MNRNNSNKNIKYNNIFYDFIGESTLPILETILEIQI